MSTGHQEDIDLVVAFEQNGVTWLLLVEAKGVGSWTNKQMRSKLSRLGRIFGEEFDEAKSSIRPRLCLASPRKSAGLAPEPGKEWPQWMIHSAKGEPYWVCLPVAKGRKKVTGCTEGGIPSSDRKYWKVEDVPDFSVEVLAGEE